jgi:beta-glucosidase/6-phospho-beta-glucosidase/beta-galactosidase
VKGAATGDVACDSYHRYKEDIALLKALDLKSYRLSISWPRIQADGTGAPNPKGLDYYKRLADALLAPDEHRRIPDDRRIQFMRGYLHALGRAMVYGANVRAYHHWSLMDNFEWAEGYAQRFSLTYVDFRTQKHTIKDSGRWYAKLASTGSLT